MRITRKYSFWFSCFIPILLYVTDKTLASAPPQCKFKCRSQGGGLLKLEEGVTYIYNLEGNTETLLPKAKGPFGESVKVNVKAKVEVSHSQCKAVIQLKDVHITGPDGKVHSGLPQLEQHPLVVSLRGGRLDSEVCAVHDDDFASLNIKRAVASLLQANTGDHGGNGNEVDVFGGCPTQFKVTKEGDVTVVTKHKDLEKCQFRENLRQSLFSIAHGHSADIQTTPLLDSNYEAEQRIKNGILESATVKEDYLFRPFANRENGARTKVITRMVLESKIPAPLPAFANNEPRSIFFENPHETVTCNIQTLMAALHKVADSDDTAVSSTAAKNFNVLVRLVRRASKEDLLSVYGNCKAGAGFQNRDLAKKVFGDALFAAGSADSVGAVVELLRNNEISDEQSKLWYLNFAFVRHASASSLASAITLFNNPKLPFEAYLGVGALAGHYCREHTCEGVPQLDQLLGKFTEVIGAPAKVSRDKENYVIAALKGLKNIKHLNDETANKITHVMKDGHVSSRIRVAALETAQSDACRGKIQKGASDIFYNREEDSELRIKAFLVLVECPNPKLANKLSEFMETEPVNQVGAFVTSYLRNLRSSSNPDKETVREILYNVKPRRKFPFDIRKFSRNHEFSYNIDSISSSAAAESNVIFSQKSYLPRSVNLNLTVEVFGHAFNLFELNGRAENLERIYERYFGPRGYIKSHKPIEIVKDVRNMYREVADRVDGKYKNIIHRGKRSVSIADTDRFASKVKLHNSKLDYNIDVDLSLKVLGNEISWVNIEDIDSPLTPSTVVDKMSEFIEKGIGGARDFRRDFKNHFIVLDTDFSYPTSTGFPLRLNAFGSSVVYVKLGGDFDASAFFRDPKNGLAKFEIVPSASVELTGELAVDAYAVEAGVKLAGNLHSSTGSEISLRMLNGHGFDLHVGLPVKKSDVLTLNTEVFSFVREQGMPSMDHLLEFNVPRKDHHGCFDQLQALVGLTFCGDIGFPSDQQSIMSTAAMYPLNGHSKLSFRIEKEDETLSTYHMKLFFDIENPKNRRLEFKIDTPGTQHPREVSFLAAVMTEPEKAIDVQFVSPLHKFVARGAIVDNDAEYSISAFAKIDDVQEYRARLGFINRGSAYTPVFEVQPAGGALADVKVDGEVIVEKQPGSPRRRFTFRGVKLISPKLTCTVDGTIATDERMFESDLHVSYDQHTVGIKSKFQMQGPKNFKINAEVSPSQFPDFNVGIKYEYQRDDHHLENNLVFSHGRDLASTQNKLSIFQQVNYRYESLQNFDIGTKNTISYPLFEMEGRFEGALTRRSVNYNIEAAYGKYRAKSRLNAKTQIKALGDYEIEFGVAAFDKELNLEAKREIVDPHKSRFIQKLEVKPGRTYDLAAEITHSFANNEVKVSAIATSTNYPNYALDAGLIATPSIFDGHCKIHDGSKHTVEGFLKFSKIQPLQGSFKLFVENQIDSHGEYTFQDGKVNGVLVINIVPVNKIIKGSAELMKAGPKYTGLIEGSALHNGQPRWTVKIETDTDLTTTAINSRNKVGVSDKHLEVNFHGDYQGKETDGGVSGGAEITLPDGKYITGTLKEALHVIPGNINGELFTEFGYSMKKGDPLSKVFLNTFVKNLNYKKYSVDSMFEVGGESPEGQMKFSNVLRSVPNDERLIIDQETSFTGSLVKMPFQSKTHAMISRPEINFDVSSNLGEYHLKSNGKINTGIADRVRHLECLTEIVTPLESVRRLKLNHLFHFVQGDENKAHVMQVTEEYMLNDKMFRVSADGEIHPSRGSLKGSLTLPGDQKPSDMELKYISESSDADTRKGQVSFMVNYDNDKTLVLNTNTEYRVDLDVINCHITGQTSLQNLRSIDLQLSHKKLSNTARNTDFNLVLNGEKIEGFAKVDLTPKQPLIDITANHANGKSRFYYKLNRKSDRQATSEGQIAWTLNNGGQVDFSSNVDIESYDNFHILVKVNSEKLQINKFKFEVGNKAAKSGVAKKINFVMQNADKKGFSGSVTYAVKETDVGFTIEGKGNIEFANEKHPLVYKAQYKTLSKGVDNEVGTSFTLNADFEKGNFIFEHKLSDKEFFYVSKFCKDGHCALSEAKNKLTVTDYLEMEHEASLIYQSDLEGRNYDFKAFTKTNRKGLGVDHETGLKLQETAYSVKYYVHDGEGGLVVYFPHREIAAVASYSVPFDLATGKPKTDLKNVHVHFDGSLYLDRKNKPQERGNLIISGEYAVTHPSVSTKGEIKATHPALHKDLVIRGKGAAGMEQRLVDASIDIDIFNRKNQRIAAALTLDHFKANDGHNVTGKIELISKGLNLDTGYTGHLFANEYGLSAGSFVYYHDSKNIRKEAGTLVEANPKRFFALIKIPNKELLKIDSVVQGSPQQHIIETEINLAELRHYFGRVETAGLHSVKAFISRKDMPDKKLEMSASSSPSAIEFRVDKMEGPAKDNLLLMVLASNKNQEIRPNFEINSEKIKHCIHEVKQQTRDLGQQIKTLLSDLSKESVEEYGSMLKSIKKVQPDFKPLLQHYQTEFEIIRKELAEDPQFKKFSTIFQNVFGSLIETFEAYIKKLVSAYEKLSQEAMEFQGKMVESTKEVYTKLIESGEKLVEPIIGLMYKACDTVCSLSEYALDFLKEHEAEIRQILAGIGGYVHEITQFCTNTLEQVRHEAEDFYKVIVDQVKNLPIVSSFQEKFKELTNVEFPQSLKNFYSEFTFALEDILKTPELKNFYENLFSYLIKFPVPSFLVKLPKIGTVKEFSLIRYLKSLTELPTLTEYYFTYRPFLNLEDNIPPFKAYGIILNSHHFFTFDQKHYTFKGTCSYILAQDFLDGNFSIVANIDNGKIKSITLSDQRDTIEMFNDNTVAVNGNHGDYPVNHNDFNGWVRYGTINMKHKSGVFITKYQKQDMFIFRISGFYFGRTRGMLGTISNEWYDDYTLPNGNIAKDAAELANSYKVIESCAPSTELPPAQGHAPECTKFFSSDSELKGGFNLINHEIYREACDQHVGYVSSDRLSAACDVASAYVLALKQGYMPYASVPNECVQCMINGQPTSFGQKISVPSPNGKADVVIVFEQSAFNGAIFRELVTPLIASLSHDLREKGLGDVEFALIGYSGPGNEWPQHFGNNGKITYEGKADNIKFKGAEDPKPVYDTWEKRLNFVIKYINTELGKEPIVMAMQEANIYPFRQGASKIILLVNSQPCPLSPTFPFSLQVPRIFTIKKYYNDVGLQFHLITPMQKVMKVSNRPDAELKNVVGFDANKIYTFADAKKSDIEGDPTDRPHLMVDTDLCLAFSQSNGGAAFNSNVFVHAKPEQQKKFVHVVSRRIAKGAAETRFTESCTCREYHGIFFYPECRVVERV